MKARYKGKAAECGALNNLHPLLHDVAVPHLLEQKIRPFDPAVAQLQLNGPIAMG